MVNEKVYDKKFFQAHIAFSERYTEMAQWLCANLKPKRAIDFGCGNGFIISQLKQCGVTVTGVEGSLNAIEYAAQNITKDIQIADLNKSLDFGKYDLVICSEVAEHLPKESADAFVNTLSSHSTKIIFFTAAEPGQGGVNHINEQPHEYWIEKFNMKGFIFLKNESQTFRKYLQRNWKQYDNCPTWFIWNSMIFRKATQNEIKLLNIQLTSSRRIRILHFYLLRRLLRALPKI